MNITEKAPQTPQIANNANNTPTDMAYRYRRAYESLLKKESEATQKEILSVTGKETVISRRVDTFIKSVAALAESDAII